MSAITGPSDATRRLPQGERRHLRGSTARTALLALALAFAAVALVAAPVLAPRPASGRFVAPYAGAWLTLALGLWTHRNRRGSPPARLFLALCAALAAVLATTPGRAGLGPLAGLWEAAVVWAAGVLIAFVLIFPAQPPLVARRPALGWLPALAALLIIAAVQVEPASTFATSIAIGCAAAALLVAAALLLYRVLGGASPLAREQSRVALAGLALTAAPLTVGALLASPVAWDWLMLSLVLFPTVLAYTINQDSMLDSGRLLTFAVTYSTLGVAITLGYALLLAGFNVLLSATLGLSLPTVSPAIVGLLTFALVLVFEPVRARLQRLLDTYLFRTRDDYQARLTSFRHQLTLVSGLDEVVRLLKQQVREGLVPTHTFVFLRDSQSGDFVAAGEGGRADTDVRFEPDSGLVHALSTARDPLFLELDDRLPPELVEDHARLAVLRTPVLVPLQGQDRLAGWLAVGPKRSGEPFTIHDLRHVQALAEQASLAVERAQVIADLERRVRELDVLSQVAQAINFTTDPDVLLELIYAQTSKLIDTTNFYVIMHDEELHSLAYTFFVEDGERRAEREGEYWPDDEGLAAEIIRTGRPIRAASYAEECARRGVRAGHMRHTGWMGVPLNTGPRTGGVMVAASYARGAAFSEDQLKIFWAIADQAATALDKARLFNETRARARQLSTLNEIARELSSTLDLDNLLGRIMRAAVEMIGVEAGSLLLLDSETSELVFRMVDGGEPELIGTRLPLGVGIVSVAVETKQPVMVNNVRQDTRWYAGLETGKHFHTQALLAVPLLIQDQSIGVLELINRRDGAPFDEEDVALLTTFAAQAAIAIENARLYQATDAELARRVDELQTLQRIDRELNRTLELNHIARTTLDWAMTLTGASAGLVGLLDEKAGGIRMLSSSGYADERMAAYAGAAIPLDTGIAGRVARSGQPELTAPLSADPDYVQLTAHSTFAQITVPIPRADELAGVLLLESATPGVFGSAEFDLAQRLVEHAAVAIENARLLQALQDANRSKTEFVSFVSHELKNPMTSIRGYTDLLRSGQVGPLNDMQEQFLSTVRSNVDRMTRLVSDLADVARIEAGNLRLDMEPTSVVSVVEETLRGLQAQIEAKGQTLQIAVEDDLPEIYADHTRMVQVLTNLLSNAHKYTPEGGRIEVGASLEAPGNGDASARQAVVHHWVRDTGIGMSPEELEQLFTKFFRTQQAKDMAPGTGLGLNITKSLVEQHGGRVWVETRMGAGSVFHFTIPVAHGGAEPVD